MDDHSTDDTGAIAATIAASRSAPARHRASATARRLVRQAVGMRHRRGDGARRAPRLPRRATRGSRPISCTRVVNAMATRGADLLSVAGTQEMGSFWERLVQPQVFAHPAAALRQHGAREPLALRVAEDRQRPVPLGATRRATTRSADMPRCSTRWRRISRWRSTGSAPARTVSLVLGLDQLSTRMYTSLRELIEGWGKNIFAGGRDAMPFGALGRAIFPLLLVTPALFQRGAADRVRARAARRRRIGRADVGGDRDGGESGVVAARVRVAARSRRHTRCCTRSARRCCCTSCCGAMVRGRRVRWKEREYRAA